MLNILFIIADLNYLILLFIRYGNLESRFVPRPDVIAMYHGDANAVDAMNQLRQNELRLETKWVTQDGNFQIATGTLGMTVVDVYCLSQHHGLISSSKYMLVFNFTVVF